MKTYLTKLLFLFVLLLALPLSSFAEDFPPYCYLDYVGGEDYERLLNETSFTEAISEIVLDIRDNNFTYSKQFRVSSQGENYIINFNSGDTGFILGDWSSFTKVMNINVESIDLTFPGLSDQEYIVRTRTVILHELVHLQDFEFGFINSTDTFNLIENSSLRGSITLDNQNFFLQFDENSPLVNNTAIAGVPIESRWSLSFDSLLFNQSTAVYDQDHQIDELIARISSVCLYESQNGELSYYQNVSSLFDPLLCNEFNFNQQDLDNVNKLITRFMENFFVQERQGQFDPRIDNSIRECSTVTITNSVFDFYAFLDEFLDFLINLRIEFVVLTLAVILIAVFIDIGRKLNIDIISLLKKNFK